MSEKTASLNEIAVKGKEAIWHGAGSGSLTLVNGGQAVTGNLSGLFSGLSHGAAVVTVLGLSSALNAGLAQVEYRYKRDAIKDTYKQELAAKLGLAAHKLSGKEIARLATDDEGVAGNKTITEAINHTRKERNLGIVLSVVAGLGSFAVLGLMAPGLAAVAPGVVGFLAEGVIGILSYNAIKAPLKWVGHKLMGLDKETTHDRIVSLKQDREAGRSITREQVLSVFAAANPQLDRMIISEYGGHFQELSLAHKQQAAEDLSKLLPLNEMTAAINDGKMNVTELAFTVDGQVSGFVPGTEEPLKHGLIGNVVAKVRGALSHKMEAAPPQTIGSAAPQAAYAEAVSTFSHAARLGRRANDASLSHVERLAQSGVEPTISPSI